MNEHSTLTRRTWMTIQVMAADLNCGIFMAQEAVASTALAHPEWDMEEERTWEDWAASDE